MRIFLNQKETILSSKPVSVSELVESNNLPLFGIALAINNKVVRKADWDTTYLKEGDNVTIITAVCGG